MIYGFLGMELDEERFELRNDGRPVRLEPRALDVLFYLARNRDRVVSKEELIEKVWGVKFVSESALHHSIRKVREALADATDQEVIRTVHGRGFRFVAPLAAAPPADVPPAARPEPAAASPPEPEGMPVALRKRRRLLPAALLSAALIGLALLAVPRILSRRTATSSSPGVSWYRPLAPSAATLHQVTSGLSTAVKPAFSPDGKVVAYVSYEPQTSSKLDIYVMAVHGGPSWRLTDAIGASGDIPVFTADAEEIVFSRFRSGDDGTHLPDLWRVGSMGGAPRLWLRGASGAGFSPDGRLVAYTKWEGGKTPLWGGAPARPEVHAEIAPSGFVPRFSPDGKWLAFTTSDPNGGLGHLLVRSLESNETKTLTPEPMQLYGIAWLADSETLIFAGRRRGRFVLWMARRTSSSRPEPLTLGIGDFSSPTVSPDGATLLFAHGNDLSNLVLADRLSGGEGRRLTNDDYHQQPRLSPGGRLAVSLLTRTETEDVIVVTDLSTLRRTVVSDGAARHPCWIDAGTVGFLVDAPAGGTDVVAVDVETMTRRTVTRFGFPAAWLAVAPGGKRVAVEEEAGPGRRALVVRDLETGRDSRLDEGRAYEGIRFSPDGGALAFSGPSEFGTAGINGIFVLPAGGSPRQIAPDGHSALFAPGGAILFVRLGESAGLWKASFAGGPPERIRPFERGVRYADAAGERLLWTQAGGRNQIYSVKLGR